MMWGWGVCLCFFGTLLWRAGSCREIGGNGGHFFAPPKRGAFVLFDGDGRTRTRQEKTTTSTLPPSSSPACHEHFRNYFVTKAAILLHDSPQQQSQSRRRRRGRLREFLRRRIVGIPPRSIAHTAESSPIDVGDIAKLAGDEGGQYRHRE